MNEAARTPSLGEAREDVRQAWLQMEARKEARKEAEKIRDRINGKGEKEALAALEELTAKHSDWGQLIRLDDLVRQKPLPTTGPRQDVVYEPYKISPHDIEYPAPNFVDSLLKLKANEA